MWKLRKIQDEKFDSFLSNLIKGESMSSSFSSYKKFALLKNLRYRKYISLAVYRRPQHDARVGWLAGSRRALFEIYCDGRRNTKSFIHQK